MTNLTTEAEAINNKFSLINKQFEDYQKDIENYKVYLQKKVEDRDTIRHGGSESNPGAMEQNAIIDGIKGIVSKI